MSSNDISDTAPQRASIGARRNPGTEAAVLDAAMQIISEQGFADLTMEAVARRARAGKATLYRWWPSRGHLLLALFSRAKTALPDHDTGDLRRDLALHLGDMLAQLHGNGGQEPLGPMLRLLIAEAQSDPSIRTALDRERRENWVHLRDILNRARERGQLNPAVSVEQAGQRIIASLWYLLLNDLLPPADQAGALIDSLSVSLASSGTERDQSSSRAR